MQLEENVNEIKGGERIYPKAFNEAALDHKERYQLALNYIKAGDNILDAATGVGYGAYYLAVNSRCEKVVGIDINDHAINWGKKYFSSSKNVFINTDLLSDLSDKIPEKQFDVVTCFETIEHIKEDYQFLKQLSKRLKDGGILLISSPNEEVIPCLENPFYPGGKNPHHHRHYSPTQLRQLLVDCGFTILETYTQCPDKVVRGENGFVIVYVCTNAVTTSAYNMNPVETGIESLNIIQMRKKFTFLGNSTSNSIDLTSINFRIDELLISNELFMHAYNLIEQGELSQALIIAENINSSLCPESYFLLGLIHQTNGLFYKAIDMYSRLLQIRERLNPLVVKVTEEQLAKVITAMPID